MLVDILVHTDVIFKSSLYKVFTIRLKVYFYRQTCSTCLFVKETKFMHAYGKRVTSESSIKGAYRSDWRQC